MKKWTLNSWRNYPVKHIPEYENKKELNMVLDLYLDLPILLQLYRNNDLFLSNNYYAKHLEVFLLFVYQKILDFLIFLFLFRILISNYLL